MMSRLCSLNLLRTVITGVYLGMKVPITSVQQCWNVCLEHFIGLLQPQAQQQMLGLISRCCQIYTRKSKETRNTNEFNLKQTTLRRITECLYIVTRICVKVIRQSKERRAANTSNQTMCDSNTAVGSGTDYGPLLSNVECQLRLQLLWLRLQNNKEGRKE